VQPVCPRHIPYIYRVKKSQSITEHLSVDYKVHDVKHMKLAKLRYLQVVYLL